MPIAYFNDLHNFLLDIDRGDIDEIVLEGFRRNFGRNVSEQERRSWRNSLASIGAVLQVDPRIPSIGVGIELNIQGTGKRIDLLFSGYSNTGQPSVVLVELKQWESANVTEMDGIVSTFLGGGFRNTTHPSQQAWSYANLMMDFNVEVYENNISIIPCAFLHNYLNDGAILDDRYANYLQLAPIFIRRDRSEFRTFIWENLFSGDDNQSILKRINDSEIRPSKSLSDGINEIINGNDFFNLIDDQKVVFETALDAARKSSDDNTKRVVLIDGGPGTGKSVIAVNLLAKGLELNLNCRYVSKNSAPRDVYHRKLTGGNMSRFKSLFQGSGSFHNTELNSFNMLIVDEAHRMTLKSGMYQNLGEDQVLEVIRSANTCIFFIDEAQRVHIKDYATKDKIRDIAQRNGAEIIELELTSQFRCNGSDGYLVWLENMLGIGDSPDLSFDSNEFDFRVIETPSELRRIIQSRNGQDDTTARLVAGYCWPWISKKNPELFDFNLEDNFTARWNLTQHGQAWLDIPESINEIGCIHTCQGLEVDYIGVIVGPDLVASEGVFITDVDARAPQDRTVWGRGAAIRRGEITQQDLDSIIRNTYRCLMTRGSKGCYIYCTDRDTANLFRSFIDRI